MLPVVKIAKRDRGERSDGKGEEKWTLGMRQDNIKHGGDYTNFANYQADVDADAEGDVESEHIDVDAATMYQTNVKTSHSGRSRWVSKRDVDSSQCLQTSPRGATIDSRF